MEKTFKKHSFKNFGVLLDIILLFRKHVEKIVSPPTGYSKSSFSILVKVFS